ncbi:hypothetical protein ACWEOE_41645 [Amycolatopsis sp. NPDC004368]
MRVDQVEAAQAHEWAEVMMSTFGFDPVLGDVAAVRVGLPGWQQFATPITTGKSNGILLKRFA